MRKVTVDPEQTAVFIMEMLMADGVKFPGPWEDIGLKIEQQIAGSHDPDIAGLELTEAICFDKLRRENAELREALRPFAQAADDCNFGPDTMTICDGMGLDLTIGHCRQARTLLSQSSEGGGPK